MLPGGNERFARWSSTTLAEKWGWRFKLSFDAGHEWPSRNKEANGSMEGYMPASLHFFFTDSLTAERTIITVLSGLQHAPGLS